MLSSPILAMGLFLGVLVFIHELGHFLIGRLFGIAVEVFSIGFGPVILSFTYKKTNYRLSLIPLGGYVKFVGTHPDEEIPSEILGLKMHEASLWARFMTILAGPVANFLLGVVIFAWLGSVGIEHLSPIVGQVLKDSAAEKAGLKSEDRIFQIDDTIIHTWDDFKNIVSMSPGIPLKVKVQRQNKEIICDVVPEKWTQKNIFGENLEEGRLGITPGLTPPLVTVLSQDVSIKTGDRIKEVQFSQETSIKIQSWEGFVSLMEQAKPDQAITLTIEDGISKNIYQTLWRYHKDWQNDLITDSLLTIKNSLHGLEPLDRIIEIEGESIHHPYDFFTVLARYQSHPSLKISVMRKGQKIVLDVPQEQEEIQSPEGKKNIFFLKLDFYASLEYPAPYKETYENIFSALWFGTKKTGEVIWLVLKTMLGLILGRVPVQVLGGPIMMAKVAQESMARGLETFLTSLAMVSVNLGVMNLLPIPLLDGGQILLILWQTVTRRPPGEKVMESFQKLGFVMLLSLIVLATYNDLSRFWSTLWKSLGP